MVEFVKNNPVVAGSIIAAVAGTVGSVIGILIKAIFDRATARETTAIQHYKVLIDALMTQVNDLLGRVEKLEGKHRVLDTELHLVKAKYWLAIEYIRLLRSWGTSLVLGHASIPEPVCPPAICEDIDPAADSDV